MCTCVNMNGRYFGRNLDLEYHYDERVTITPRRFPLPFRHVPAMETHHAMIGMATIVGGYPLYYEATNEHGVSMAGLNFPGTARYSPMTGGRDNVTPFEFIPWVLGRCSDMAQVRALLSRISLLDEAFSAQLPLSPLHWMIACGDESLVVEATASGLHIHENPVHVMTNNPTFDVHLWNLSNYMALSPVQPENRFPLPLAPHSSGMGALGLPGDYSSPSRFVKTAYTLAHSVCGDTEADCVGQFFHILTAVAMPRGSVLAHGKPDMTIYTSCCDAQTGVYYYTTYENRQITAVNMRRLDLDARAMFSYPLIARQQIFVQNA